MRIVFKIQNLPLKQEPTKNKKIPNVFQQKGFFYLEK